MKINYEEEHIKEIKGQLIELRIYLDRLREDIDKIDYTLISIEEEL